ncbi:MAG: hypothetical protein L3J66_02955 [Bacteroidales bacterium]|nr:hypothetical protein [Bacteroidales bacterium]
MKIKYLRKISLSLVFVLATSLSIAQLTAPSDPPGGGPQGGDPPVGGGAPVGSGLIILLVTGAAYGGKKLYTLLKENGEETTA